MKIAFIAVCLVHFHSTYGDFLVNPAYEPLLHNIFMTNGNYDDITINGIHFAGTRPWIIRWNMIKNACSYANLKILDLGSLFGVNAVCLKKYGNAKSVTAVDCMESYLKQAALLAKIFEVDINFIQADLDNPNDNYEQKIGTNYDVVFCLSVLFWVHDKDRLLKYLSNFNKVIFEGHGSAEVEEACFKQLGFDAKRLGVSENGRSLFLFHKSKG